MLKKKERLTKKEFDRFFASGRRLHFPLFTTIFSPAPDFHAIVVVGKKVYKSAVDRNRLRRRLYNILYRLSRENELKGVYIVLTKPTAAKANFAALKAEMEKMIINLNPNH